MAGSYVLPQVRVFQEFAETPNDVTQNLNPFIIGPNYQLIRYADEDERADCTTGAYSGSSITLAWSSKALTGSTPDTAWYGVTMADAYVALGSALTPASCLDGTTTGTKFEFTLGANESLTDVSGKTLKFGVAVKPGDYLAWEETVDNKTVKRYTKIREVSCGKLTSGTEITSSLKNKKTGADATGVFTVTLSDYVGEKPATVVLNVTGTTDLKLTWSSNVAGISQATPQDIGSSAIDLGKGLKVTKGTLSSAGTFVLSVSLIEPYARDTVRVSDIVAANKAYTFVRKLDAVDVDETYLAADTGKVTVADNVQVKLGSSLYAIYAATAYLNQRNFRKDHTDGVYSLRTDAEIITELGAIVPENPLAYAAHVMLLNCATAAIKYIGVKSDDLAGFATALERASVTNEVYAFCPLTEDREIIDAVVADCNRLSTPEEKSWRVSFFSMPTDSEIDVTPNVYGVPEKCKVSGTGRTTLTCYNGDTSTQSSVSKFNDTVVAGDTVVVINTKAEEITTTVASVTSDTVLELAEAVDDASASNCRFRIIHKREQAEYVEAIAATSESFKDRRAYNVFPNRLRDANGTFVSGMYAAAAVCGLACSVAPQQPITNVEIKGFTDLPDVYSTFSRDELNTIASGGTLILMQEKSGGSVYVRHQISTAYSSGNLNSTELSLTKNLDSISYYFANRFAPYIGRYNLTEDLLTELRGILEDGLAHLETSTETNRLIGPQVIAEGTEIRALYIDPDEKDKAYANVSLNLPAPFNNFDLHLQVI